MDKILILLLGLLAVCVAFLVFAYNQKDKLAEKKVKERFEGSSNCSGCPDGSPCDDGCPDEQENFECVDGKDSNTGEDCTENFKGYRENFECVDGKDSNTGEDCTENFMSNNCDDCPGASDCGQRGCPTAEQFCGTGSCFQEGFRSGSLNRSYRKPAGQEFFQGYGIESFSNGGNYNELNENFEEESNGEEHYQNYVREDFESQPATLKLFYADWCGHCKRFKPTFENELPRAIRNSGLGCKLVAINADEQPDLVRRYNVKGFPTMILERNGRLIEYNGDRTVSDIERFISKNL
jgi:thiol-disulfide isomerase/thioredoxin